MKKAKKQYTLEEAGEVLNVDRNLVVELLTSVRASYNASRPGKIKTSELERMARVLKQREPKPPRAMPGDLE